LSRVIDLAITRGHEKLGEIEGIELWYYPRNEMLHLHGRKDRIESIKKVAMAIKETLTKTSEDEAHRLVEQAYNEAVKGGKIAHMSRIYETARHLFGMGWDTFKSNFSWLITAAKKFALAVDGVPTLIEKLGRYEVYALLRDKAGDPPVTDAIFTCLHCRTKLDIEGLTSGTQFCCPECCNWYNYTYNGDVEIANPPVNTATIHGTVKGSAGEAITGAEVFVNKRLVLTDDTGHFILKGIPAGKCKIKVKHPTYETSYSDVVIEGPKIYEIQFRVLPRFPRYFALPAAGAVTGWTITRDPLGGIAGFIGGVLINMFIDFLAS
jgi:hypothetical protein